MIGHILNPHSDPGTSSLSTGHRKPGCYSAARGARLSGEGSIIGLVSRSCRANNDSLRGPVDTAFMAPEKGPVEELPATCTLGPDRGEEQLRRWRALDGGHLLHRSRQPDEVSRRELTELIDVEQECCGFLTWTVIDTDDELALVVRGSPAELDALSAGG